MGVLKLGVVLLVGGMLVGIAWHGNTTRAWEVLTAFDPDNLPSSSGGGS